MKFKQFSFAVIGAIIFAFLLFTSIHSKAAPPQNEESKQYNIVFILSDDHRYDFMGFLNKPSFLETPAMDRMAREGAHLENAFVVTSLCSPSRASILTGKFPQTHGVVDNQHPLPEHNVIFPQYLKDAGYKTAFIGKWHMGGHTDEPQPGFDHWVSFPGQGVYYDPEFNVNGESIEHNGYITDLLTDYAVEWIGKQSNDQPFMLYLSHKAVHAMFEPAKRHLGLFDKIKPEYPASMANTKENYRGKPEWVKEQRHSWHGVDYMYHGEMEFDTFYRRYCETLLSLDESIGRVLNALEKKELSKNTLVIYTSDNGFTLGEHGLIDKRHMYRESIRIPLLALGPGLIKAATKITNLIQNVDFAPTFLEAAGIEPPDDMDGKSFLPLLKGTDVSRRKEVYYEYYWERPFPHTPTVFGVRTETYKYMTYHGIWDIDELYNMQEDPREMNNLINSPEHLEVIKELRKKVFDWLEKTNGMQIPVRRSGLWQADERGPEVQEQ